MEKHPRAIRRPHRAHPRVFERRIRQLIKIEVALERQLMQDIVETHENSL